MLPNEPSESNIKGKKAFKINGWGTWIRTRINGVRVRGSTVELSPILLQLLPCAQERCVVGRIRTVNCLTMCQSQRTSDIQATTARPQPRARPGVALCPAPSCRIFELGRSRLVIERVEP